jgi:hypothetical protein
MKSKKPVKLFRKEPSKEFIGYILREMGLLGFHDLRWFSRDEIKLDRLEDWLPEIESYYLPCKAERFIHTWSDKSIITILRHMLHLHGYTLEKEERLYKNVKQMLYQIQPLNSFYDLSGASLEVDFL